MKKKTREELEHRILMLELTVTTLRNRLEKLEHPRWPRIGDERPTVTWQPPPPRWNGVVTCKTGSPREFTANLEPANG